MLVNSRKTGFLFKLQRNSRKLSALMVAVIMLMATMPMPLFATNKTESASKLPVVAGGIAGTAAAALTGIATFAALWGTAIGTAPLWIGIPALALPARQLSVIPMRDRI